MKYTIGMVGAMPRAIMLDGKVVAVAEDGLIARQLLWILRSTENLAERQLIVSLNTIDPPTAKHGARVNVLTKAGAPMPQTVQLSDSVTVSMSVRWA